jgi:carboxylesterase type B
MIYNPRSLYDARVLATLGKIIVITFNYRLGVLGECTVRPVTSDRPQGG